MIMLSESLCIPGYLYIYTLYYYLLHTYNNITFVCVNIIIVTVVISLRIKYNVPTYLLCVGDA